MLEKIGVYAGSFDPFTNGHLAVVEKAAEMLDKVIVVIGVNPDKKRRFEVDIMRDAILKTLNDKKNI
jgi:pantetheine-phosphate adenylyltransferase